MSHFWRGEHGCGGARRGMVYFKQPHWAGLGWAGLGKTWHGVDYFNAATLGGAC